MAAAAKTTDKTENNESAEDKNLPAVAESSGGLPAHLASQLQDDAGLGLSKAAEDNILPLLYVLQSNSPQVQRGGADTVKGAAPGDLWVKGATSAVSGETGVVVQPCAFRKDWVEWVPRNSGGGYVGRHDNCPEDAKEVTDPASGRTRFVRPNGNEVNETRYHYGLIDGSPVVIPFTSTGHTSSRDWMNKMNNTRLPNKQSAPSFATLYRLTTRQRTNKSGSWYAVTAEFEGWVPTVEDYNLGKTLFDQVEKGAVRAADEDPSQQGGGTTDGTAHDPETGEVLSGGNKGGDVPF